MGAEALKEASTHDSTANVTIEYPECPECHFEFNHHIKTTFGDPRNIALIGHWDGWQPFSSSTKHSSGMVGIIHFCNNTSLHLIFLIGAIEISIATMLKADRSKNEEVYVCGFVPNYLLPNRRPNAIDPFLCPLIEEVEECFADGILLVIHTV